MPRPPYFLAMLTTEPQVAPHELLPGPRVVLVHDLLAVLVLLLGRQQGRLVDFLEVVFECDIEDDSTLPPD